MRDIVAAASTFERWLWALSPHDRREIFKIPPEQLDGYLAEFFTTIKRRSGEEYQPKSLTNLRKRIDHYLIDCGYQHSIISHPLFEGSRNALRKKLDELKQKPELHPTMVFKSEDSGYYMEVLTRVEEDRCGMKE